MNLLDFIDSDIPCPIFVRKITNHNQIKQQILDSIEDMGKFSIFQKNRSDKSTYYQKISNTDYHLTQNRFRPYFPIIEPILREHHKMLTDILGIAEHVILSNYWFQQYENGDYHGTHIHDTPFSSVYYIELPGESPRTTLKLFGKEYQIEVQEGDILTFPGFIPHESKENKNTRKTIIAFNSTYEERY